MCTLLHSSFDHKSSIYRIKSIKEKTPEKMTWKNQASCVNRSVKKQMTHSSLSNATPATKFFSNTTFIAKAVLLYRYLALGYVQS
jgi:hypothetical protein